MAWCFRSALIVCLGCLSSSLHADGLYLNGVSPRSIGRGGTNLGFADNGGIIFDNPAAMANVQGRGLFDASVDVLITDFEYSDPQNPHVTTSSGTPLPQISTILKSPDGRFAYGLGLFVPAGFTQSYDMQGSPLQPGPQHYESYGSLIKILPAVAWKATDRLSIGGTLGVAVSQVELQAPYFLQSVGLPSALDLNVDGAGLTASVGLQYELTETTTVGFTWQSKTHINMDGDTRVALGPGIDALYDTDMTVQWPRSLALGVRQEIGEKHVVSADTTWYNWSETFDNFRIVLGSPTNPFFPPGVKEPFPLDWKDTVSMRLGYEYHIDARRTARLGYVYHPNPIPNSTLTPFIQAITEHAFSCGYGFQVLKCEVDLAYMLTMGDSQSVGTSAFLGGDFDNSRHDATTHAVCVSLIKRF